jgi:5-formyltetrahydrofolate cyclo-ligase
LSPTQDPRTELRRRMADQRRTLDPPARMSAAQGLRRNLEALPAFLEAPRVAGYWACDGELPLNLALAAVALRKQRIYLPQVAGPRHLRFAPWSLGDEVQPNRYGIPEPATDQGLLEPDALDLVLVPLLAFDRSGNRIGYGGGFYDASFAFLREAARPAKPLLVGIGYAFQECEAIEPAGWDIPLDYVATDRMLIDCHQPSETS